MRSVSLTPALELQNSNEEEVLGPQSHISEQDIQQSPEWSFDDDLCAEDHQEPETLTTIFSRNNPEFEYSVQVEQDNDSVKDSLRRYQSRIHQRTTEWWKSKKLNEAPFQTEANQEDLKSYTETINGPDASPWKEALSLELAQIEANGTWEKVEPAKGQKVLSTKFVFMRKFNEEGEVARYKVRLVVHGYKHEFSVDFWEIYAPVVDFEVSLAILRYLLGKGAAVHQVDFATAFLNGDINEDVYVTLPNDFDRQSIVYKSLKSLYGLKQSP